MSEQRTPIWYAGRPASGHEPLGADTSCDVLVIGTGIVGASTAWELTQAGVDVLVVDAGDVSRGTTGASTAKVSTLQGTAYSQLQQRVGHARATEYAALQALAVEHLATTVERTGIECDLHRRPSWLLATDEPEARALAREHEAALDCGLPVVSDDPGLPFDVDAAIRLDGQLVIDPVAYCEGLLADVVSRGGRVHTHTRVVDLEGSDPHRAVTAQGHTIRAGQVVVATHFPSFNQGLLFARLHVQREHVLAAPAPDGVEMPDMYTTASSDVRSLRVAPSVDGDVLLVSGSPFTPGSGDARTPRAELGDWAAKRIPDWRPTHAWSAQDLISPDGMPFIGELRPITHPGEGVWGATGFGGWGLTNGVIGGLLLRDLILGTPPEGWRQLLTTARARPVAEVRSTVKQGVTTAEAMTVRRLRATVSDVGETLADLDLGDAAVIHVDGTPVAVHRDPQGELHSVHATCPHMGCVVGFDRTEGCWACPCHGSRFDVDGRLLEGPATRGLATSPLPGMDSAAGGYRPHDP